MGFSYTHVHAIHTHGMNALHVHVDATTPYLQTILDVSYVLVFTFTHAAVYHVPKPVASPHSPINSL